MKSVVNNDVVLSRPLEGPLSTYIPGFAQWTCEEGYAFLTRQRKVMLAACFSRWLKQQKICIACVTPELAARYLRYRGTRLTPDGVHYLLVRHVKTAANVCPSLKGKRVTVHGMRHTMAMDLLQQGVDRSVIALWLGHESLGTTQIYLEATLAMKERALSKTKPLNSKFKRYQPGDQLLGFLNNL